ncbi:hypothetical protein MATL_G00179530 [Megalops atlanticus]|uniref:Uncharacterized protein n=1 Tax=Megalops atlanticus TaxID=7932 RepID=A0A9D3PM48_MEGAT|nr:hypothetical protein MATL_G00179530 [Megalops atlanticus]
MKDLSLSLLSRGCGHTQVDSQGGRIDVCFEPEDYFNWKSQRPMLRLTESGRIRCEVEPAPPKTYSTRRGPLVLYSEDLALPYQPGVSRKRHTSQPPRQKEELHTSKDLKRAYDSKQNSTAGDRLVSLPLSSSLPFILPSLPPLYGHSKSSLGHVRSTWHPRVTPRDPELPGVRDSRQKHATLCPPGDKANFLEHARPCRVPQTLPPIPEAVGESYGDAGAHHASSESQTILQAGYLEDQKETKKLSLRIVVEPPRVQMSPVLETEPVVPGENAGSTEDQEQEGPLPQCLSGCPAQVEADGKFNETRVEAEPEPLRMAFVDSSWRCSRLSHITYYGGHLSGTRRGSPWKVGGVKPQDSREGVALDPSLSILHLPQIHTKPLTGAGLPVGSEPDTGATQNCTVGQEQGGEAGGWNRKEEREGGATRLPSLCDPARKPPQREVHRKVLLLPLFLPDLRETTDTAPPHGAIHGYPAADKVEGEGFCPVPLLHTKGLHLDPLGLLQSGEEDTSPLGVLPPLGGRRGPGKQSSMALFRQDLFDPRDLQDPETGVVRGSLPVELREWQKGSNVGTLIMGPDGEIIRVSLWGPDADTTGEHELLDDFTRRRALSVLATEVKLDQPWAILLQTDPVPEKSTVGDMVNPPVHINPSTPNPQCDLLPDSHQRAEESQNLHPACGITEEEECSLPKTPREKTNTVTTHLQATGREEGTAAAEEMHGPLPAPNKSSPGSLPIEVLCTGSPGPVHPMGEAHTTEGPHTGEKDPKTTAEVQRGQSSVTVDAKEAKRKGVQKQEDDTRSRKLKEASEEGPLKEPVTQTTGVAPFSSKRTEKGGKEKQQSVAHSEVGTVLQKKRKRGKQKAEFVVGKTREKAGERTDQKKRTKERTDQKGAPEERTNQKRRLEGWTDMESKPEERTDQDGQPEETADNKRRPEEGRDQGRGPEEGADQALGHKERKEPDMVVPEAAVKEHGSDCTTQGGNMSNSDPGMEEQELCPPTSHSSTGRRSHTPTSPRALSHRVEAASHDHLCTPTASIATESQSSFMITTRETPRVNFPTSEVNSNIDGSSQGPPAEARALREQQGAARAERRRLEVERKRKEKEEERRRQQEKEEREERMRLELLEEQQQRTEELRLRKLREEEERQRQEEQEREQKRREQAERERERRRQEEKKRQLQRFLKSKQEEEERRAAELERLRLEEEARKEEERRMLQAMQESERQEYLLRQYEEEQRRRREEAERRRREEEEARLASEKAKLQAELFARQRAALEQQLQFRRGLQIEAGALELTQGISRPWVYSYFTLLKLLGLEQPTAVEQQASDSS